MYSKNFKKAFTMIELVFVIVIIGILASVAIPKLAATRDDAVAIQVIHNLKTYLKDVRNYYTTKGKTRYQSARFSQVTEVAIYNNPLCSTLTNSKIVGNTRYLCASNVAYVKLGATDADEPAGQRIIFTAMSTGTVVGRILSSSTAYNQLTQDDGSDPYPGSKSFLIESSEVDFD